MAFVGVTPNQTPRQGRRQSSLSRGQHSTQSNAEVEEDFLHAVDFGDTSEVKRLVKRNPGLNVDCTDALGRTPLRLAVKNENKEMVEILLSLSNPDNIHEAVLQAIDAGSTNIAEVALRHPRYLETSKRMRRMGDTDGFFKPERGSQFPSYITPLNLAAQKNQYIIVQLLLQRGETIPKPHKFSCACMECMNKLKFDQLRFAKCRLSSYQGLSSEAYISLCSQDPFLTTFELADELKKLSHLELIFKREYRDIVNRLHHYAVKLLNCVWTQRELSAVLDKTGDPSEDTFKHLARFKLAVAYKQKLFVAHPSCQQRIVSFWYEGLGELGRGSLPFRLLMYVALTLCYPALVVAYLFWPESKFGSILKKPVVKFISYITSLGIFLTLIIVSTWETIQRTSIEEIFSTSRPELYRQYAHYINSRPLDEGLPLDFPLRIKEPLVTDYMLTVFIVAMVLLECQEIWFAGAWTHFTDAFNCLDFLLLSVYVSVFTLRYWIMIKSKASENKLSNEDWNNIEKHVYWLNADRLYWSQLDPQNMAEGLFAMANILSFSRICYLLPANENLGPLQISLGRMINDILKFLVLVLICFAAFMVALRNLFWYYANREHIELDSKMITEEVPVVKSYGSESDTFRTMFWNIYGRAQAEAVGLGQYNNTLTEDVGQVIDGLYNGFMIIVLFNMLIAMMSKSFDRIAEDSDIEWKYARSALYLDFIAKEKVLPVPLNILELLTNSFSWLIRWIRTRKRENDDDPTVRFDGRRRGAVSASLASLKRLKKQGHLDEDTSSDCDHKTSPSIISKRKSSKVQTFYQCIIQSIIQRYLYHIQRESEDYVATLDDVKVNFERMRAEALNQHKEKDELLSLAVRSVLGVAHELSVVTGRGIKSHSQLGDVPYPWTSILTCFKDKQSGETGVNDSEMKFTNARGRIGKKTYDVFNSVHVLGVRAEGQGVDICQIHDQRGRLNSMLNGNMSEVALKDFEITHTIQKESFFLTDISGVKDITDRDETEGSPCFTEEDLDRKRMQ